MPRVSAWLARAGLIHLCLGFTLGALLLVNKALDLSPALWRLRPAHIELLLVGWTLQLVMAVAVWILPRARLRSEPTGRTPFAWAAFALINVGVLLAATGPIFTGTPADHLMLAGRLAEIAAAGAFLVNVWTRIRPSGLSQI